MMRLRREALLSFRILYFVFPSKRTVDKCKVLPTTLRYQKFSILPFDRFSYEFGNWILDYVNEKKDLGVIVTSELNVDIQQAAIIISKAINLLGLLMRTYHFTKWQVLIRSGVMS